MRAGLENIWEERNRLQQVTQRKSSSAIHKNRLLSGIPRTAYTSTPLFLPRIPVRTRDDADVGSGRQK
jgi:hypothetical protein